MSLTLSPNLGDVRITLYNWFKELSGLDRVIWANQARERPDRPYAMLNITSFPKAPGQVERNQREVGTSPNDRHYIDNRSQQPISMSTNVYTKKHCLDEDAFTLMMKVNQSVEAIQINEWLKSYNIAYFDKSEMRNLDEQLAQRWEKRAQQDFQFRFVTTTTEEIQIVEEATINSEIKVNNGNHYGQFKVITN